MNPALAGMLVAHHRPSSLNPDPVVVQGVADHERRAVDGAA